MNIALIMCAGSGKRMEIDTPKQFISVLDKPLFVHTIDSFIKSSLIDKLVLVINKNDELIVKNILKKHKFEKDIKICFGGSTRQKSVFMGLKFIRKFCNDEDLVLIHDAARANVSEEIIERNIEAVKKYGNSITAIKIFDTVAEVNESNNISKYVDREKLISIQTPQSFYFKDIFEAHERCALDNYDLATDDSSIILYSKMNVYLTEGSKYNIKVTTQDDLKLIKLYLENKIR